MKTCRQCKQEFQIFDEDRKFYTKINAPEPTWCPECRNMRRCAYRNERVLYMRSCDLCKKSTLSTYHADAPFSVYCSACWWSDNWDALDFGREFDFSRSFFDQFHELAQRVPHIGMMAKKTENSVFCNEVDGVKDSYMSICSFYGEQYLYAYWLGWSKDIVSSSYILRSELCYECQDVEHGYNCRFVFNSQKVSDSAFCFACSDCTHCFMCVNMKHKSYCILNKQYTKEGYEEEMKKYNLGSHAEELRVKETFAGVMASFSRKYAFIQRSENCTGDYLSECKDVYRGFDSFGQEGSRYVYDAGYANDCMDILQSGLDCELLYETHSIGTAYRCFFSNWAWSNNSIEYCDSVHGAQDLFGCFGLRKKSYCILNKQYSKEEYESLRKKIIEHMKKTGECGEFFPLQHSPYAYNETIAQQWYPKTKEEVLARGWNWCDDLPGKYDAPTIEWSAVPDDINDTSEDIIKNIFACQKCRKNYRIIKQEFAFYKAKTIPLPRLCPDCRFYERFSHRNPRTLWHRQCMCEVAHENHTGYRCTIEFETPYAPDRKERVYCSACYEQEVG